MRIAQISPLFEAVPPKLYGGTERVVYALTEELVAMGHDVTLFASGDSITSATLAPMRDKALRLDPSVVDWIAIYMRMMELIRRRAHEFDVLHFHTDYFPLSLFSRQDTPFVTTLHGRLDIPEFKEEFTRRSPMRRSCRFRMRSGDRSRGSTGCVRCCMGCRRNS